MSDTPGGGAAEHLLELESHRLEVIALVGGAHATRDALLHCLDSGISVAWFSKSGRFRGRIVPAMPRNADLRVAQYATASEPSKALALAREFIIGKCDNARRAMTRFQSNHPATPALGNAIQLLMDAPRRVQLCTSIEQLFGVEGAAARAWFEGLQHAFQAELRFSGRAQRPPPDPVNALLSYAYTLLANLIAGRLEARGLDVGLGFLHGLRPGRASLALDLIEEFRIPIVDRFVLKACNLRQMSPEHFEPADPEAGVRMTRPGLQRFFTIWDKQLQTPLPDAEGQPRTPLDHVNAQIELLVATLREGQPYKAFRMKD